MKPLTNEEILQFLDEIGMEITPKSNSYPHDIGHLCGCAYNIDEIMLFVSKKAILNHIAGKLIEYGKHIQRLNTQDTLKDIFGIV
jgi:hypothetical protein